VTDADVLAVDVHLADMRQRQTTTAGDLAVARIELNEAVGLPLDEPVTLARPPLPAAVPDTPDVVREALATRPERRQAELRVSLAENARRTAESALLPRVGVQAGWAFNGATWSERALRLIAGAFVVASVLLGIYVNANFLWFTLFVGLNLFQSAFTNWCPMMAILRKGGLRA
jgi:outer membrane protein TolC